LAQVSTATFFLHTPRLCVCMFKRLSKSWLPSAETLHRGSTAVGSVLAGPVESNIPSVGGSNNENDATKSDEKADIKAYPVVGAGSGCHVNKKILAGGALVTVAGVGAGFTLATVLSQPGGDRDEHEGDQFGDDMSEMSGMSDLQILEDSRMGGDSQAFQEDGDIDSAPHVAPVLGEDGDLDSAQHVAPVLGDDGRPSHDTPHHGGRPPHDGPHHGGRPPHDGPHHGGHHSHHGTPHHDDSYECSRGEGRDFDNDEVDWEAGEGDEGNNFVDFVLDILM